MLLDRLKSLPKDMFDLTSLSISELSQLSGIEEERLQRIINGSEIPTLEDIDMIQNATGISDEMIASILESEND